MPLNGDTTNPNSHIKPDFTIFDLKDLLNILPISAICHRDSTMTRTVRRNSSGTNKRSTHHHQLLRVPDLDLDNGNSNSSDGS